MSVHNHPPYRPNCNERIVDGKLRGACMDDTPTTAEKGVSLTDPELEQLCDAFVASSRAEFLDTDLDLAIRNAIERIVVERMRQAWHQGYGAGSSNATDGWLRPGSERTTCPYTTPLPSEVSR